MTLPKRVLVTFEDPKRATKVVVTVEGSDRFVAEELFRVGHLGALALPVVDPGETREMGIIQGKERN